METLLFDRGPQILALLALLVGGFLIRKGYRAYIDGAHLVKSGEVIAARVTGKRRRSQAKDKDSPHSAITTYDYFLTYGFGVDGQDYGGELLVSREEWEAATDGDPLDVRYLPSDPSNNQAASVDVSVKQTGGTIQMAAGAVITSVAVAYLIIGRF